MVDKPFLLFYFTDSNSIQNLESSIYFCTTAGLGSGGDLEKDSPILLGNCLG